ncbi:MAG: hypothetical protein AB7O38_31070 [Pirellulaceae bacterium]
MSKWRNILRAGLGLAAVAFPPAAAALPIVNALLPDDQRLDPATATVDQVVDAADRVPPDRRAELDLELDRLLAQESVDKLRLMVEKETATANTRPAIAERMAWAILLAVFGMIVAVLAAVFRGDHSTVEALGSSWELLVAVTATPAWVVRAYFGDRTRDKQARLAAATDQHIGEATAGALAGLVKAFRGR